MKITKSRKAQMEIMGIAFVVILIVIGLTFLIKYSIKPPVNTQQEFGRRELPKTIITSIVEITSTCNDEKMSDLIQDCSFGSGIQCQLEGGSTQNSCDYLSRNLKDILDKMLVEKFKYRYKLSLTRLDQQVIAPITGVPDENLPNHNPFDETKCATYDEASQPMMHGLLLTLKICY